jgi:hypothetical protein
MSTLLIESELDMDIAIERIIRLANLDGDKTLTIVLPSAAFHEIFIRNLHDKVIKSDVETPMDIEMKIIIRRIRDD